VTASDVLLEARNTGLRVPEFWVYARDLMDFDLRRRLQENNKLRTDLRDAYNHCTRHCSYLNIALQHFFFHRLKSQVILISFVPTVGYSQ
jgi:hypothetical protein